MSSSRSEAQASQRRSWRARLIWTAVAIATLGPVLAIAASPQLQWRHAIYITASVAGTVALSLLLVQPLLISGYLPGWQGPRARRAHRWIGTLLLAAVVIHVATLWFTSAPDVIDALLFQSPTPFSPWGVVALWATVATAGLAAGRQRLRLRPQSWRLAHLSLATTIVTGTIVHALLIDGAMETNSKIALCTLVGLVTAQAIVTRWRAARRRQQAD